MNADEKVELVRKAVEQAMTAGPHSLLERYDELCTADFRWTPALEGADYVGRDGLTRAFDDFGTSFDRFSYRSADFRAVGEDTVIAKLRIAVHGAESGVPIDQDLAWVFRFRGDKVESAKTYLNWADAEAAAEGRAHA